MADSFFKHEPADNPPPINDKNPEEGVENPVGGMSEDRRITAVMASVPFLCFAPLLKMRDDPYVYFHARQGLVLFFLEIIVFVFSFPHLAQLFWTVMIICCIGAAVAGVMFAMQGRAHKLPLIGDLAERLKM